MATTLTGDGELTSFSFPIIAEKTEEDSDGNLIVYGVATDGSVDSDEQIVDPVWAAKAVREWLETGPNIRVQHQSQRDPAGVGISMETGPNGETYVKSRVIETEAKRLVKGGALRAYSVGIARPKIVRDAVARGGRIVDGELCEISLVDRPANKNCGIQLVTKSADGSPEWVGKAFGIHEVLTKADDSVSLELPKDVSVSFSPADLAKLLKHRQTAEERVASGEIAEKRQMDPSVGGGVDRDKLSESDFAGRNRSFPIVTPGDVSDAASSIGRAGPDNYSSDELRRRITSIAHRKGPSFVAELPQSWKTDTEVGKAADEADLEKGKKPNPFAKGKNGKKDGKGGKKPAFPGASKPFGAKEDEAKPDATKGEKDCPKCGAAFHADSKLRRCEKCHAKLPTLGNKSVEEPEVAKDHDDDVVCQKCGAMTDDDHKFCSECGNSLRNAPAAEKNHDFRCLGCGEDLDKGEKFCPECGKKNPGYLPMADAKLKTEGAVTVEKKKKKRKNKPVPGEGVVGPAADDIDPVPSHREPDGMAVEAFEADAGLPTDPDRDAMKAAARHAAVGAPSDLATLHDHLCSAFDPSDVAKCFPTDAISELSIADWQQKALDAAASAPLEQAQAMTHLWQHAVTLKGADPEIVAELRAEAFKEYKDGHPGPGSFPSPTELDPTRFRRDRLAEGHSRYSPAPVGEIHGTVPTGHICADDFTRDYQTAGRAEQSPSNKSSAIIAPAPLPSGMGRTYYRNAEREAAKSAMAAMHDHIAQTFPDLCPASGPGLGGEPAEGARPVPLPVGKSEETVNETDELTVKAQKLIKKAQKAAKAAGMEDLFMEKAIEEPVEPVAPALNAEILKSALAEATLPLLEQLADAQKAIKKQQKMLDALAELPDPREAPFKGLAMQNTANKSAAGVPVGARTVAENAERTQQALMQALQQEARNNPDPAQREAAWSRLYQMTGITTNP